MLQTIRVPPEGDKKRLDQFLSAALDSVSRTRISRLIVEGKVKVDGKDKKASFRLHAGSSITVDIPEPAAIELPPFEYDIPIIYEDEDILIIDKPQGITTHPPQAGATDTLVNALVYMKKELAPINPLRPGIVHRLDRETSGVMVIAKTNRAYLHLTGQFRRRLIKKEYRAIVWGKIAKDEITIDMPVARDEKNRLRMKISFLNSKNALTTARVLNYFSDSTYIGINIHTGRMHQIRVHMKFLECPIIGDKKYGIKDEYNELFLHAYSLGLNHPVTEKWLEFQAPLPERFTKFLTSRAGKIK
jgi:23S rRNA pseudouridine1911/1915/1917 synthase